MSKKFVTSDQHFFHEKMASLRGFTNVEEMNSTLINNWNSVVGKNDLVYFLGDMFCSRTSTVGDCEEVRHQLNGQIYFVRGNHDHMVEPFKGSFLFFGDRMTAKFGAFKCVLDHYPMKMWEDMELGVAMLHGHSHHVLCPEDPKLLSFDVGVDVPEWNMTPVSAAQVEAKLESKKLFIESLKSPVVCQFKPEDHKTTWFNL